MAAALVAFLAAATPALAARSDWVDLGEGRMRLHLTRSADGGAEGAIEIALEPGWHTYWQSPGDAGIPPTFDFQGSENVAEAEVLYPAPRRLEEAGLVSIVYEDVVVMPLTLTLAEPEEEATLSVQATLGICREICIPVQAEAEATLEPLDDDPLARVTIERGLRSLPGEPEDGRFAIKSVTRQGEGLVIELDLPEGAEAAELFAAGPQELYLPQPVAAATGKGRARFTLALDAATGEDELAGSVLDLVAVAGGEAIAQSVAIPPPGETADCITCD